MSEKIEKKRHTLVPGDGWSLLLECRQPGHTFLLLEQGGKVEARVPIENVLQGHLKVDEGAEAETQRQIATLRRRAGDWESKYYDNVADKLELQRAKEVAHDAVEKCASAESELAHLRQTIHAPGDPTAAAKLTTLMSGAMSMLRRCPRCSGEARIDGMPCPYCGVFRELVSGMRMNADAAPMEPAYSIYIEAGTAKTDVSREEIRRRRAQDVSDLERGQVAMEGSRQERLAELDRLHVFMLHPGVGSDPYWELASERDPEVMRLRSGKMQQGLLVRAYGGLPPAFMPGLFMALEQVGDGFVFTDATPFVEVDRERGLAALPDHLRGWYRGLAEGRW